MKVRDVVRMIEKQGWVLVRTRGSHRQYKHPERRGVVTIPGNLNSDLAVGTLRSILKATRIQP
ncbi:MAG: type II toxin-antitoxin system HicA family toxin [Myxococcota bacterium]